MNLPFFAVFSFMKKEGKVIPRTVEKAWIFESVLHQFSTAKKPYLFWLFGTYPSYPLLYGYSC